MQSGGSRQQKVPDLNREVQDLLLEVVHLKQEVPDLRSGGILPPQFNPWQSGAGGTWVCGHCNRVAVEQNFGSLANAEFTS